MSDTTKRLLERRATLVQQMREVAERAVDENRDMSAEEDRQFTAMNAEVDALQERVDAMLEGERKAQDIEDSMAKLHGKPAERQTPEQNADTAELRAFLRGERGRAYDVAPSGRVFSGNLEEARVLSKLTAGAGGNVVPTSFYDRLVAHLIETASLMSGGVTILNTASGEVIQVPKTTAHSSASIVTEGSAITPSDPAFGQVSLGAFKYGTLIQVSRELLADEGVDIEGYLSMQVGRALGNAFGAHIVTGTGTGQPRGLMIDTTLGVTGATGVGGAFNADNLIDLEYAVIAPYRASNAASWVLRDASVGSMRKLKDSTGQYLWNPSLVSGRPDTFDGYGIIVDPNMAAIGVNNKSVAFGDLSQYFVRLAGGVRFERSDDYAFNTDLVTFRALFRADGALIDTTGAVKHFVGAAT